MLSDSVEVSTSNFDLYFPPAISITRPGALLPSPTISRVYEVFLSDAQANRAKC